jgi:hypothetical protein
MVVDTRAYPALDINADAIPNIKDKESRTMAVRLFEAIKLPQALAFIDQPLS